jgi:Raf kinase inhibitor-like YbhB/YbcL family protein
MSILRQAPTRLALASGAVALLLGSASLATAQGTRAGGPPPPQMVLTTTAWSDGQQIPAKYTQAGDQTSPELKWTNAPPGTQSFVLNMLDPDVALLKSPEAMVHWVVWNIPSTATGLPEGVKPGDMADGAHQISSSGPNYRGPGAAASGPLHHYTFEVYALDTKIEVAPSTATPAMNAAIETRQAIMKAMQGHVIGKAVYVGLFHRPQ